MKALFLAPFVLVTTLTSIGINRPSGSVSALASPRAEDGLPLAIGPEGPAV